MHLVAPSCSASWQVARLKKTWAALEADQPTLMHHFRTELVPLADPGNGIYAKVLERVQGMSPPCVPFLGSFLTALERTKVSMSSHGTGKDTVG